MDSVPSLNLPYLIARSYEAATGVHVDPSSWPSFFSLLLWVVGTVGLVVAFIFLVALVYVAVRLVQTEHEGFAKRMEKEEEHYAAPETPAGNPRWEAVAALVASPEESDWRRAIMEADVMLNQLLIEHGIPGETLGEQLKHANPLQFATLDAAWEAHKMRNALAHMGEAFPLSERDARQTIDQYRRVFEEFKII